MSKEKYDYVIHSWAELMNIIKDLPNNVIYSVTIEEGAGDGNKEE